MPQNEVLVALGFDREEVKALSNEKRPRLRSLFVAFSIIAFVLVARPGERADNWLAATFCHDHPVVATDQTLSVKQ